MTPPLVEISGLVKRFAGVEVLAGLDLAIEHGESIAIVGPSGSGKSTLLNILGGLLAPSSGSVKIAGVSLSQLDANGLAALRNREIGFVFQSHHLLPQCTALENALLPSLANTSKSDRAEANERARSLLEDVGLGHRLDHHPARLSGGECQRVAVVRALINRPRLLLADEPTGSLDARNAEQLGELLCELNAAQGVSLVTVTHADHLASRMQRAFDLRDGVLRAIRP